MSDTCLLVIDDHTLLTISSVALHTIYTIEKYTINIHTKINQAKENKGKGLIFILT